MPIASPTADLSPDEDADDDTETDDDDIDTRLDLDALDLRYASKTDLEGIDIKSLQKELEELDIKSMREAL
ncbi:MAG: hypothetical protein OXB93_05175, partial [Cytophagales bacterium]|nr:hypothetical protein [Cytophagales bacterium]